MVLCVTCSCAQGYRSSNTQTKLGIWNGRILELEQYFCNGKLIELKLRFWSKFESWESLELGELKLISRKKHKVKKS